MLNRVAILIVLIALAVVPAAAQTSSTGSRTFVDLTLAPDWDDYYSASARVPGVTWRGGIAFGMDWGRSGIQFETAPPR